MADAPLIAHSLAEAYLYLKATPCSTCQKGPLRATEAPRFDHPGGKAVVSIDVACHSCRAATTMTFELPGELAEGGLESDEVNPTDEPSRIIDPAQWLTLWRVISELAGRETDKVEARQLALGAAQCLEEALKFFDEVDNHLPPPEAFFHDSSRCRFQDNPEEFTRRRLINLRSKLPVMSAVPSHPSPTGREPKTRWWRQRL